MKITKTVSPIAHAIATVLLSSAKAGGRFWDSLRDILLPLSVDEAEKEAKSAREALKESGYDRKTHGQCAAEPYLSDMLFCKRNGAEIPENRGAMTELRKKYKTPNAKAPAEGEKDAEGEAAKAEGFAKMGEAVAKMAEAFNAQPEDVLALAKEAHGLGDILLAVNGALAAGVARVTIIATLRQLQKDQQQANRDADAAGDAIEGEARKVG